MYAQIKCGGLKMLMEVLRLLGLQAGLCRKDSEERCDSTDEPTLSEVEAHDWMMTEYVYCLEVSQNDPCSAYILYLVVRF